MKTLVCFGVVLVLAIAALLPANLAAGDKKEKKKDKEPTADTIVEAALSNADLKDKVRTEMYCKTYTYKMVEGRTYQLDMTSADFDSYLRLEDPKGDQVAADDDGGGFPSAKIVFRAPKTGDYTIICTTYSAGATGKYKLVVKDLKGEPTPKEEKIEKLRPAPGRSSLQPADGTRSSVSISAESGADNVRMRQR